MNAIQFQRCFRYTCTHPYIFRLDHAFQSLQVRWKSCTLPQISQQSMVQHESPLYCTQCTSLCWNASQSVKTGCFYRDMYLASYTSWGSALQALLSLFSVTCFLEPLLSSYALLISFYPPNGNVKYRTQHPTYALDLSSTVQLVIAHQALERSASKCELVINLKREEHNTSHRLFLH